MTCRACGNDHSPLIRCEQAARLDSGYVTAVENPMVTVTTICNHCVTKDGEIERLRNQLAELRKPAKRNRAAYMREWRKAH